MAKHKGKHTQKSENEHEEPARLDDDREVEQAETDTTDHKPDEPGDENSTNSYADTDVDVEKFEEATEENTPDGQVISGTDGSKFQRFKRWFGRNKKLTIPGVIVLLIVVLAAIPFTRYSLAGLVLKQTFVVRVFDTETNKPVSSADVTVAGKKAQTDGEGRATLKVRVGNTKLSVEKKYYEKAEKNTLVPIAKQKQPLEMKLKATGRQVPITVINKITKKPLENATIAALDTKANTDKDGKAVLVLPADKGYVDGTITADKYNELKHPIAVNTDEGVNVLAMTPAGSVYFLSDRSGTLDVVKANLDGDDRKVVLAGTGKEDKPATVLLASRDWKYLALLSKRDGGENAKLFLIDTSIDKAVVMDEGKAGFTLTGWSDHRFVYTVNRTDVQFWQANRQALKTYDADSKKIATLDQTGGVGDQSFYSYDEFNGVYILKNEVVYIKSWQFVYPYNSSVAPWYYSTPAQLWVKGVRERKAEVRVTKPDGTNSRTIKSYGVPVDNSSFAPPATVRLSARAYEPQSLWVLVDNKTVEEYEDGQMKAQTVKSDDFWSKEYATHLVSPSGEKTFWSDVRDGKNTLLVGDQKGENSAEAAKLSDYDSYGWYTDQYLLVSKKGSELYVMPVAGGEALKLTDYYKPKVNFEGYGYGYGGL